MIFIKYSKLTETTVRNWLTGTIESSKIKEIEIVQTTSTEFIGKIEDLNGQTIEIIANVSFDEYNEENRLNPKKILSKYF